MYCNERQQVYCNPTQPQPQLTIQLHVDSTSSFRRLALYKSGANYSQTPSIDISHHGESCRLCLLRLPYVPHSL